MKRQIVVALLFTAAINAGEPNRATLNDIKEATAILMDEVVASSKNADALKARVANIENNQRMLLLEEEKIKKNAYTKPSQYDAPILEYIGKDNK